MMTGEPLDLICICGKCLACTRHVFSAQKLAN